MSKNIHTPRHELVCGKLDLLTDLIISYAGDFEGNDGVTMIEYISYIRHDCERMEAKLAEYKLLYGGTK